MVPAHAPSTIEPPSPTEHPVTNRASLLLWTDNPAPYIDGVIPTNNDHDWVHYRITLPTTH